MTAEEERELVVATRLRALAMLAMLLGTVLLVLAFVPVRVVGPGVDVKHVVDIPHRIWMFLTLVPGAWVLKSPRLKPVSLWAAWFIAATAASEWLLGEIPTSKVAGAFVPWWPPVVSVVIMLGQAALIVIVLPLIRLGDRELPELPRAHIYRGE